MVKLTRYSGNSESQALVEEGASGEVESSATAEGNTGTPEGFQEGATSQGRVPLPEVDGPNRARVKKTPHGGTTSSEILRSFEDGERPVDIFE